LPAGATYGQCLREALLRSAIAGDTSAAKELLERLEGPGDKSERKNIRVHVEYGDKYKDLDVFSEFDGHAGESEQDYRKRSWELSTKYRLEAAGDPKLVAAWSRVPPEGEARVVEHDLGMLA